MNNKQKMIFSILAVVGIIVIVIGSTFAYWRWQTSDAQKTNVTFTVGADFSCSADGGGNITNSDVSLIPTTISSTTPTDNYIKRTIKVTPTIETSGKSIWMDLWLNINSLSSNLANSTNFKYAFTTSSTSPTTGVVESGNFNGITANADLELFTGKRYSNSNVDTYYLWIWLDAAETNSNTMNQTFNFSLGGSCTDTNLK